MTNSLGGVWFAALSRETALPARRCYSLDIDHSESKFENIVAELWEVNDGIKVEKITLPKIEGDKLGEEDEDGEPEEEEIKEKMIEKHHLLGSLTVLVKNGKQEGTSRRTHLEVQFVASADGKIDFSAWESGPGGRGEAVSVTVQPL